MDGRQIGVAAVGDINEVINRVRSDCAGDPVAQVVAMTYIGRALSSTSDGVALKQEVRRGEREAILALHGQGWSDQQVADALTEAGCRISRERVRQVRSTEKEGDRGEPRRVPSAADAGAPAAVAA
jgi:hypothetical protein